MSKNPFRPPSIPSQESDITKPASYWYPLRLIPAFFCLIVSLWMCVLSLALVLLSIGRESLPPVDAIGLVVMAGISSPVFAITSWFWYQGAWKSALLASLIALIGCAILIAFAVSLQKNNEQARSNRMLSTLREGRFH